MAMARWLGAWLALLGVFHAGSTPAQVIPVEVPPGLVLGFPSTARARLPLDTYQPADPAARITPLPWSRNVLKAVDDPLPLRRDVLPPVFMVQAGDYADDVRLLAERQLLEPVDTVLAELGMRADDFSPALRAAFSYGGTLYAIPHHVNVPVLRYWRGAFGETVPAFPDSWEELAALGKPLVAGRGADGPRRVLSIPLSTTRFAALVAMSCGEPPLDVADPVFFQSVRFVEALRWVLDGEAHGVIQRREANTALTPALAAVFGIDHVDSFYAESPFGILPFPHRLRANDAPAEQRSVAGRAEGIALRNLTPQYRAQAIAMLRWLFSPETAWQTFEQTHARVPSERWLLDNVHLPLRAQTLESLDFDYALKKFPELSILRQQQAEASFAKIPAPLEDLVWERAEAVVDYLPQDADLQAAMETLVEALRELVRSTPVESVAYAGY